jgi:glycosyltransferase involved in cell wall biosynthesis
MNGASSRRLGELTLLKSESVIIFAPGFWDESSLDVHRYAQLLAENNRVLFVERAITPFSGFVAAQREEFRRSTRWLKASIRDVAPNIWAGAPPPALPLRFETPVLLANQWLRCRWTRYASKILGLSDPIVWFFYPDGAPLVGKLDENITLYSVTDDYPSNPFSFNRKSQVRQWHYRLAKTVDIVIATSGDLAEMNRSLNKNLHYIPHGVEHELFRQALMLQSLPDDLASLPEPRIGFVGRVNDRVDIDIIRAVAQLHPNWSLVFIGPVDDGEKCRAIGSLPNTYFFGRVPVEKLPQYLSGMAACIIPYKITEHTRYMHPLKALEYLSAGRPVVSTRLPALRIHENYVVFANEAHEFVGALEYVLSTDTLAQQHRRSDYTRDKTWRHELGNICALVETARTGKILLKDAEAGAAVCA